MGWQLPEAPHPAGPALTALHVLTTYPPGAGEQLVLQGQRIRETGSSVPSDQTALCLHLQEAFQTVTWLQDRVSWDLS